MSLGRKLRRLMEDHGPLPALQMFNELVADGSINRQQISFMDLATNIVGDNWQGRLGNFNAISWRLRESAGGDADQTARVMESGAGEAVDASAFADITGQLLINEVKKKFESPSFIGDRLVETIPITNGNLGTQKTPWTSDVMLTGKQIQAGMPYTHTKFVEQYITYPAPEKFGEICSVTMEMIYSDLTSQALDSAGSVGRALGYLREQKIAQVVLGGTNNYNFGNEAGTTAYNTYQTAGTLWTNNIADEILVDWTNVNNVEQLFFKMVDPATGRRILVEPKVMLVMPQLRYTAKRIIHATQTNDGNITSGAGRQTEAPNPLETQYNILYSPIFYEQMLLIDTDAAKSTTHWFLIDPSRAFVWRQVYGLRTESAPKGNPMEFNQDIAVQVKAGWFGVAAVRSPYHVAKGYDA